MERSKEFLTKYAESTAESIADFIIYNKLSEDDIDGFLETQNEEVRKWLDEKEYQF